MNIHYGEKTILEPFPRWDFLYWLENAFTLNRSPSGQFRADWVFENKNVWRA